MGGACEPLEFCAGERGGDEQNGVGAVGARFDDLILVDGEVLAQTGQANCGGCNLKVAQASLKVWLVGQDGERGGAAILISPGDPRHIEVFADQSF